MNDPKYLVQLLERSNGFCKMFKLVTMDKLHEWVEDAQAVADVCSKRNPSHMYVMYISNNAVDLAKGEAKLIQQEAIKKLRGEQSKIGIITSTKAMYLGMGREITSFDFDTKEDAETLRRDVIKFSVDRGFVGSCTNTPNGIHIHLKSKDRFKFESLLPDTLKKHLDKVGHEFCSPIAGTYKGDYLISKHKIN